MAQPLPRAFRLQEQARDRAKLDKLIGETDALSAPGMGSADGHEWARRRGLPLVGLGIRGTTAGTDPLGVLISKERRPRG